MDTPAELVQSSPVLREFIRVQFYEISPHVDLRDPATVASGLPLRAPDPGPGVSTLISVAVSMCPFRKRGRTHPRRLARFAQRDLLASPVLHPSVPRSILMLRGTAAIVSACDRSVEVFYFFLSQSRYLVCF